MSDYENLRLEVSDYIATVTLDRPPVNALSSGLYRDIADVFLEIGERTSEIRVAILTGAGRSFCAGRDLKLAEEEDREVRSRFARASFSGVYHSAVPVIAAVNGYAMGAGFLTALMCDFIVAADTAIFGLPEIDAGLNMSISKLMRGFNQYQARYLAFTADRVDSAELYRMNIVQKVFPADDLLRETRSIAGILAAKSPEALRAAKWSANQVELLTNDHERKYQAIESRVTIGLLDTENRVEAGKAFAEKRQPTFKDA